MFYLVCVDEEEDEENKFSQQDDQQNNEKLKKRKVNVWVTVLPKTVARHYGNCSVRTLRRRHLFSLMAPRQPKNPVTMTILPRVMMRLAAESDGKEGERVAKLPWDTESQRPTPNNPHPPSWNKVNGLIWTFNVRILCHIDACVCVHTQKNRLKRKSMYLMQQMQPRAMTELTKTAINKIGQNVNISKQVMASIWYYCTCMQVPSEGREEYNICAVQ